MKESPLQKNLTESCFYICNPADHQISGWNWRRSHLHGNNRIFIFSPGEYIFPCQSIRKCSFDLQQNHTIYFGSNLKSSVPDRQNWYNNGTPSFWEAMIDSPHCWCTEAFLRAWFCFCKNKSFQKWLEYLFSIAQKNLGIVIVLAAYRAHVTPVNTITWNPFYPKVFLRWLSFHFDFLTLCSSHDIIFPLSCASEYNVLLWHMDHQIPVLR